MPLHPHHYLLHNRLHNCIRRQSLNHFKIHRLCLQLIQSLLPLRPPLQQLQQQLLEQQTLYHLQFLRRLVILNGNRLEVQLKRGL
jgi:hypothetical protein